MMPLSRSPNIGQLPIYHVALCFLIAIFYTNLTVVSKIETFPILVNYEL